MCIVQMHVGIGFTPPLHSSFHNIFCNVPRDEHSKALLFQTKQFLKCNTNITACAYCVQYVNEQCNTEGHSSFNSKSTTYRLVKINIVSYIEPIREGVRKNSLICKFVNASFWTTYHNWPQKKWTFHEMNQSEMVLGELSTQKVYIVQSKGLLTYWV